MNSKPDEMDIRFLGVLYDQFRNSKLNEIYYYTLYRRILLQARIIDMTAALLSSFLLMAILLYGSVPLEIMLAFSLSLLCITRPLLSVSDKQSRYSFLYRQYTEIRLTLESIVTSLKLKQHIDEEDKRELQRAREAMQRLAAQDDPRPSARLITQLAEVVNQQIPPESLWWPSSAAASG